MTTAYPTPARPAANVLWATWLLVALLWATLLNHLRLEWTINPQYAYGWGVPWLALYLFGKRWSDRPAPRPPSSNRLLLALALPLLAGLFPLRVLLEANPDWRLVSWLLALLVTSLSLLLVCHAGGSPWLRHFAFPVAFILLAVPWPTPLEHALIQNLMRSVAALTVEALNWIGVPARQLGNLIQLPAATVGVDEACSGVRSFQSTLMAAACLGEIYRFNLPRRLALVLGGILLAFALNVGRTFLLTWIMLRQGESSLQTFHDPAGYLVLLVAFAALWGLSVLLVRSSPAPPPPPPIPHSRPSPVTLSPLALGALATWLLTVSLGNEAWFRFHERSLPQSPSWTIQWPQDENGFRPQPIPADVRLALRYDEGRSGLFLNDDGTQMLVFFFRWNPGRTAAQSAKIHSPDLCLPSAGLRPLGPTGHFTLRQDPLQLPFRTYQYEGPNRHWHVFYTLWEDRPPAQPGDDDFSRHSRLRAAWQGRRHLGQQVLEIAVTGTLDPALARRHLDRYLQRWLQLTPTAT